jgi:Ca2+-binding RTX toxin-like protein
MHEIGHSLGLEHPSIGGMPKEYSGRAYTIMGEVDDQDSPMILDIAAIQHLYGANFNTNSGDTVYFWNSYTNEMHINGVKQERGHLSATDMRTIWDGGGTDTYDFSDYSGNLQIDLRPGEHSTIDSEKYVTLFPNHIANALLYKEDTRSLIENAIGGSGNDIITGNQANNTLIGGFGADTLIGGDGDDTYNIDNTGDMVIENANEGIDTIITSLDYYMLRQNIENLVLALPGSGYGNDLDNIIQGSSGNDRLVGARGNDVLKGGAGSDIYVYNFRNWEGSTTIHEFSDSASPNDIDTLEFGAYIAPEELWFQRKSESDGIHLEVSRIGSNNEKITIKNWFDNDCRIEKIKIYGGKSITDNNIDQLVNAMAAFSPPALGQETLPSNYQQTLTPIITAAWT